MAEPPSSRFSRGMNAKERGYVTYFDQRYAARALVMLRSLRLNDPDAEIFALCLDEPVRELTARLRDRKLVIVSPQELYEADPALAACRDRSTAAFRATHKPVLARYALNRRSDLGAIIHVDADTYFFSTPDPLLSEIGEASIALSPHRFVINRQRAQWFGQFNAGFIYWRNDPVGRRCLADYRDDCIRWCAPEVTNDGRFMNQGYLTAWPQRYPGVHVIQHPGVNLAPWNIAGHAVREGRRVLVDEAPLIFFHFSGLILGPDGIWRTGYSEFGTNLEIARRAIYAPYLTEVERVQRWVTRRCSRLLPAEPVWDWTDSTIMGTQERLSWVAAVIDRHHALDTQVSRLARAIGRLGRKLVERCYAWNASRSKRVLELRSNGHSGRIDRARQQGNVEVTVSPTRGEIIQATIRHAVTNMDGRGFVRVTLNGADLWLPPATIRTMTHCFHMEDSGRFLIHIERPQLDWLGAQLLSGSHFIDVGAATGAVCLPLAKRFGQSIVITAFEPARAARALLTATIERNDLSGIKISPLACSDQAGHATFYEFPQDDGDVTPFLPEASTLVATSDPRAEAVSIDVTTLDLQFAEDRTIQRAAVKIDVEGFEAKVLAGARQFLLRVRPALAIDIHANPFGPGTTEKDVRQFLSPLGYRFNNLGHVLTCEAL